MSFWVKINQVTIEGEERFAWQDYDWTNTGASNLGQLFRECQRTYGRCVSSLYVDRWEDEQVNVYKEGWVFVARRRIYDDDSRRVVLIETWVQVSVTEPKKVIEWRGKESPWPKPI